jgi:hypothetical protein
MYDLTSKYFARSSEMTLKLCALHHIAINKNFFSKANL